MHVLHGLPFIARPMKHELSRRLNSQSPTTLYRTSSPVRLPHLQWLASPPVYITIRDFGDGIEDALIAYGSEQLDVLGMRPHQRHGPPPRGGPANYGRRGGRARSQSSLGLRSWIVETFSS